MKSSVRTTDEVIKAIHEAATHHLPESKPHFKVITASSRDGFETELNQAVALGYEFHSLELAVKPAVMGGGGKSPLFYVAILQMAAK